MLEVARMLHGRQFRRTIRFLAFPCEEPPHFYTSDSGSQVYARACHERGERIIGMICLEMLGYFADYPDSQQLPPGVPRLLQWAYPRRGTFLVAVGNLRSCPHYHLPSDLPEILDYSRMAQATRGVAGAISWLAGDLGGNS